MENAERLGGVGKKATFHIYMNNTYAADYKHTRSFK